MAPPYYNYKNPSVIEAMLVCSSFQSRLSECVLEEPSGVVYLPKKESYNVYTDVGVVAESLQAPKFSLVEDPAQADIVWIKDHHKDYK